MEEQNSWDHRDRRPFSPTLRDLLSIGFRHRRLMILSFLGIFLGAVLATLLQPRQYEGQMKLLVKRERVDPVVTPEAVATPQLALGVTEEELNSEVELIKSQDLLERVAAACGLEQLNKRSFLASLASRLRGQATPHVPAESASISQAAHRLARELRVEVITKTDLISVSYKSPDPELATRVLTTLASLYLEKHVEVHRPPGASEFFGQQTKQYQKGLTTAEARLIAFTRGEGVVSADLEKDIALHEFADFDAELRQTRAAIAQTEQRIRILEGQAASIPSRLISQVRTSDNAELLQQLKSTLLTLELKRTEFLGKFEPDYRPVQEVERQIAQTQAAIAGAEKSLLRDETTDRNPTYEWVGEELAKARADLAGLQARAETIALNVRTYQQSARSLDQKEVFQQDLIRNVKVAEENYMLYLRKQEEARISDELDRRRIINVAIAEPATVPPVPANHRLLNVLLGGFLASAVSIGLAFGSEHLDSSFRTPDDVKEYLGVPLLASIPRNGHLDETHVSR